MNKKIEAEIVELLGPRKLHIKKEIIDPDKIGGKEIIAKTLYSAVSPGTEVAAYVGMPPLRPSKAYPRVVGYCNVAEVIAVGKEVKKVKLGDKILTTNSHRTYFVCNDDCTGRGVLAVIPEGVDLAEAATTYLFHLGYNALLKANIKPGCTIGVLGLGTLGIATVGIANASGAKVYGFSNQESSLKLAKEMGCRLTFKKNYEESINAINEDTQGTGLDIIITTSNKWDDWKLALKLIRSGGKICVIGFPGRGEPPPNFNPLDSQYFYDKQLELIACGYTPNLEIDENAIRFTLKRNCQYLLGLIINKKINARKLISDTVEWRGIETTYKNLAEKKESVITYVLKWD